MQADLVVIGAGLAGSCLAAAVAQQGWHVLLLERQRGPRHKVCGEFLSPESQASLRAMGLYTTVADLAPARIEQAMLISRQGLQLEMPLPGLAWGVSRFRLDTALSGAAAAYGAQLCEGVTVSSFQQLAEGYHIHVRAADGQRSSMHARALVVACGRHAGAGLRPAQHAQPASSYVGIKCHYAGLALPPVVRLYLFDGGYIGLSPIEDGRANLCLLASEQAFARGGKRIDSMLDAVISWTPSLASDLAGGQRLDDTMVAVGAVDTQRAPVLWDGCARLGDAATMIPPLCGDGQAMAIHAAELCAPLIMELLAGRRSQAAFAADYTNAWHAAYDRPLRTARWLQHLLGQPLLNDGLIGLGALLPQLAQHMLLATRGPVPTPP